MQAAIIYKPSRNAMQSGLRNTKKWVLEFIPKGKKTIDPIMGWTSSHDTKATQVKLSFNTKEQAIEYANKNNISYVFKAPRVQKNIIKYYCDNFTQKS